MIKVPRPPTLSLWDRVKAVAKVTKMALTPSTDYLMLIHRTHYDEVPTCKGNYANSLRSGDIYLDYMAHMLAQAKNTNQLNKYLTAIGLSAIRQYNKRHNLPNELIIMEKPIKHISDITINTDTHTGLLPNEKSNSNDQGSQS